MLRPNRNERDGRENRFDSHLSNVLTRASPQPCPYGKDFRVKIGGYLSEVFVSFQGEGAHVGRRHLFVRLAGCNIRCSYCDTPDSLERTTGYTIWDGDRQLERDNPVSPSQLGMIIRDFAGRHAPIDAVAFTGGEPLVQSDFLAATLATEKIELPVLLETNGVLPNKLASVLPYVDIISMDVKLASNTGERHFWDEHAAFLAHSKEKDLYVKILVDEGTDSDEVEKACRLIASEAPDVPIFLQPITSPTGHVEIGRASLDRFYRIVRNHLKSVRVLPQTHKMVGVM